MFKPGNRITEVPKTIVGAANQIIANNKDQFEKKGLHGK
jgi:hypothetical protein